MKLFSFSAFVVLATFAAPVFSQLIPREDRFEELFKAEAPTKEILMELMSVEPLTIFKHCRLVQQHMNTKNDKLAPYANKLKTAGQKILDHLLKEINYKKKVNIVKFIDSAFDFITNSPTKNLEMVNLIKQLNDHIQKIFEDALEETKKNMIERYLSVASNEEETPKKRHQKSKRSKASVTETGNDSAESGRKLHGSQLRKVPFSKSSDV